MKWMMLGLALFFTETAVSDVHLEFKAKVAAVSGDQVILESSKQICIVNVKEESKRSRKMKVADAITQERIYRIPMGDFVSCKVKGRL